MEERPLTLVFVTGADRIPPMGFEKKLTLSFDPESLYPIALQLSTYLRMRILPIRLVVWIIWRCPSGLMSGLF